MQRLVYTFERIQPAQGPIVGDVIVGIAMAAVGIFGIRRRVDGTAESPHAAIDFPSDTSILRFNLRIERALAARGVKIKKICVVEDSSGCEGRRAAA